MYCLFKGIGYERECEMKIIIISLTHKTSISLITLPFILDETHVMLLLTSVLVLLKCSCGK
jgi:hypothetical protein